MAHAETVDRSQQDRQAREDMKTCQLPVDDAGIGILPMVVSLKGQWRSKEHWKQR